MGKSLFIVKPQPKELAEVVNIGENSAFNNDFLFLDLSCSPHVSVMGELL